MTKPILAYAQPSVTPEQTGTRFALAKVTARLLASKFSPSTRLEQARSFCYAMLAEHWRARCEAAGCSWEIGVGPVSTGPSDLELIEVAKNIGNAAAQMEPGKAAYMLGTVYTGMLPTDLRSAWGAYHTPPPYVNRLMDLAEKAGFDWTKGRVIDPACGGGAFLTPVALRMLAAMPDGSAEFRLARVTSRLRGAELDPFAAWMSHVLLESAMLPICVEAGKRLPNLITVGDSLGLDTLGEFDLVVGNPPYCRVTLTSVLRLKYSRSLYGHANLYGLFTDLGIRLAKAGGLIAYVTPTSFLGGQYFKALRELMAEEAPPQFIDFMNHREGVFDDVLQETLLAVYRKGAVLAPVVVSCLTQVSADAVKVAGAGNISLGKGSTPWLLPRDAEQDAFFEKLSALSCRLSDFGYSVSTGPLVWNRHKEQLRTTKQGKGVYPLVWAESVAANQFLFSAARRNHVPFIQVTKTQDHLLVKSSCVLVQRTTAKEQNRRLIAAVMPESFIKAYGAAVVENHLNVVSQTNVSPISPATIAAVLNSQAVDAAFRCISGSVAVSAYELNALPLPDLKEMMTLETLVTKGADNSLIEKRLNRIYGLKT